MSIFRRGAYTVELQNIENSEYIKKILDLNIRYTEITYEDNSGSITNCKLSRFGMNNSELKQYLDKMRKDHPKLEKITVHYEAVDASALKGLFPGIEPTLLANRASPEPSLSSYLSSSLSYITAFEDLAFYISPPQLDSVTREQAIAAILNQAGAENFQSIEFPMHKLILFTVFNGGKASLIYVHYDNGFCVGGTDKISFDLDDGFLLYQSFGVNQMERTIKTLLQPYFLSWKNNAYVGNMFPESLKLGAAQDSLEIREDVKESPCARPTA